MNEWVQAILLSIIEGLTEFIPVSSTGHLILFGDAVEFSGPKAHTFEIWIQLGAILSVVVLYKERFISLFNFSSSTNGFTGKQGIIKLFLASLPAFIFGFLLHSIIKEKLFDPFPVAFALILGGIVLVLIEKIGTRQTLTKVEEISYLMCVGIGCFQCLALWPGISRSGATIVGGMLLGLERKIAAEFSFLMAVPVMCAAVLYDLYKSSSFLTFNDIPLFLFGFVLSFFTAILAIRFFIALLGKYTLIPFGIYRILLGAIVLYILT